MKKSPLALNLIYIIIALGYVSLFGSCTPTKNVVYFQNLQKDTKIPSSVDNTYELRIRRNDLLYIGITSSDPKDSDIKFNAPQGPVASSAPPGSSLNNITGYLVDNNGDINIYKLGRIHVEGLTREQLKQRLLRELDPTWIKDAIVTVRFLNNRVSILGEVTRPQVITMPTEKLSLLEALSMTGDVTITGRKDNILVIRETPDGKELKRLNLTDSSIFNSPFYYLKPDDIVYVEPTTVKIKNSGDTPQIIGYVLAGVSIIITVLANILR